jgi:hypothetical protein
MQPRPETRQLQSGGATHAHGLVWTGDFPLGDAWLAWENLTGGWLFTGRCLPSKCRALLRGVAWLDRLVTGSCRAGYC